MDFFNAVSVGNIALVQKHLDEGQDINARDLDRGDTALILAVYSSDVKMIDFLLSKKADIEAMGDSSWTPLMASIWNDQNFGDVEICKKLLAAGADITSVNEDGDDAHNIAIKYGRAEFVELLENNYQGKIIEQRQLETVIDGGQSKTETLSF